MSVPGSESGIKGPVGGYRGAPETLEGVALDSREGEEMHFSKPLGLLCAVWASGVPVLARGPS